VRPRAPGRSGSRGVELALRDVEALREGAQALLIPPGEVVALQGEYQPRVGVLPLHLGRLEVDARRLQRGLGDAHLLVERHAVERDQGRSLGHRLPQPPRREHARHGAADLRRRGLRCPPAPPTLAGAALI